MRFPISLTLAILLVIILAGCSSSKSITTHPSVPDGESGSNSTGLLYSGTFDIDLETQTITQRDRQADIVFDITGFLPDKCPGGCFRYQIINIVGSVLEIELTIENPLSILAYDVRIQYTDLFGKTVLNPDSYTDFIGTPIADIFPFTAFAKGNPDRAFPIGPGGIVTETLFLDFPPGAQAAVNYAITAHVPGQTPEPFEIGDMSQTGTLTPTGGAAIISCRVDDHQDNVSAVYLDAIPFTGGPVSMQPDTLNPGYWQVEISNTEGASAGHYNQFIMALSPNSQNISTYQVVEINVTSTVDVPQNVEIVVNRLSYTDKRRIDESGPFTITWDAPPGAPASYAIYVDRDPSDGYSNDYLYLDEVMHPTTSWTGDGTEFTSVDRYIPGWTYIVRARATVGDPLSESGDSDQVHVMTSSFETAPGGDIGPPGYKTTLQGEEGWWANQEAVFGSDPTWTTYTYNSNCSANGITSYGCGYVRLDKMVGRSGENWPGRWMGMMTETPIPSTMPNISVRQIDFVTVSRGQFDYGGESGGLIIGTCPSKPVDQWTNPEILDWAQADSTSPFDGYQANNQAFVSDAFDATPYSDVPTTGSNSWYYFTDGIVWDNTDKRLRGGDVNIQGNANDTWVAIESCHSNYTDGFNPETCLDEISIAIY